MTPISTVSTARHTNTIRYNRVAKAQTKREFACSFFQTGQIQGIYLNQLKKFYTGNLPPNTGNFEVLEIKGCTRFQGEGVNKGLEPVVFCC